jgi:hypothetical protein
MSACLSFEHFYNGGETSLSLQMLPLDTPASRKEISTPNYKRNRKLMTILACCMASGNHTLIAFAKSFKIETFRNWVLIECILTYNTKRREKFLNVNAPSHSNNMKINIEKI